MRGNNVLAELLYTSARCILVLASASIAFYVASAFYNVFFHPLRHIPGPKLAAATYIPEFYWDVLRGGMYQKRILLMHEEYGMSNPKHHFNMSSDVLSPDRLLTTKLDDYAITLGPVVRISPNEVHCSDWRFIDEIYASGSRKRDKPLHQVRGSGGQVPRIIMYDSIGLDSDIHLSQYCRRYFLDHKP